jgi:hypothetical protein
MKKSFILLAIAMVTAAAVAAGILATTTPLTAQKFYNANTALEFQTGTITTTAATNQFVVTFTTPFSTTPSVFVQPLNGWNLLVPTNQVAGTNYYVTNMLAVVAVNATNFVFNVGGGAGANVGTNWIGTFNYIAIGQP